MNSKLALRAAAAALCAAAAAVMSTAAAQQPAASVKVGFVNTERVMREARAPQEAKKKIEAEFKQRDDELARDQVRLKGLADDLKKNGAALPAAEREKREAAATELEGDIDRRRAAFGEDLELRRDEATKQFTDKANGIIRRIAEREKLDAVFIEAAYASARIDITDQVIKALDSER